MQKRNQMYSHITHHLEVLIIILSISFFVLNIFKKNKYSKVFIIYLFFLSILFYLNIGINENSIPNERRNKVFILFETRNTLFSLIEFLMFSLFIRLNITSNRLRKHTNLLVYFYLVIYSFTTAFYIANLNNYKVILKYSYILNQIEFFVLILICLIFFKDILRQEVNENVLPKSSLLIIGSIFLYTTVSLPFLILTPQLDYHTYIFKTLTSLHYISIICILLSIGYSTLKEKKKKWLSF